VHERSSLCLPRAALRGLEGVNVDRYARWNALLELLTETGRISVEDAADRLVVSQATIRRDFDQLAQQQMITRTRGGAVVNGVSYDLPLRYKSAKHAPEKQRIGTAAAALVDPAMVVGLTGGTTTTEVARALAARPDLSGTGADGPQLTVVTNALNIANELIVRSRMKIVVTGGVIRPQSYELVGPLATGILRELTLDMAFLGVDAFDAALGAASHHEGEAAMNSLLASRARRIVVICDSSKLGKHAFARVCPVEKVSTLVTDDEATDADIAPFLAANVEVLRV
jgi:DeoR family transcriptional regulator of aga operon